MFGGFHACGATVAGTGLCWGDNYWGQLGNGEYHLFWVSEPVPVQGDLRFTRLAAGDDNTCGLVVDGSIYCWGQNGDGHLGTTPDAYTTTPLDSQATCGSRPWSPGVGSSVRLC